MKLTIKKNPFSESTKHMFDLKSTYWHLSEIGIVSKPNRDDKGSTPYSKIIKVLEKAGYSIGGRSNFLDDFIVIVPEKKKFFTTSVMTIDSKMIYRHPSDLIFTSKEYITKIL